MTCATPSDDVERGESMSVSGCDSELAGDDNDDESRLVDEEEESEGDGEDVEEGEEDGDEEEGEEDGDEEEGEEGDGLVGSREGEGEVEGSEESEGVRGQRVGSGEDGPHGKDNGGVEVVARQISVHFDEVATVAVISPTSTAIRKRSSIGFDELSGLPSKKKKSGVGEAKPSSVS